jgi:phage baseplate assembly protein W
MTSILSHPFRFGADGNAATIDQDSAASTAQTLHAIVSTVRGEHPMAPSFGVDDPAFVGLAADQISANVALFYPNDGIRVTRAAVTQITETDQTVRIEFEETA